MSWCRARAGYMDLLRLYLLAAALSSSDYYYYVQLCTVYQKRGEKTLAGFSFFSCTVLCNSIIIRERQSPVSENVHHRFFFFFYFRYSSRPSILVSSDWIRKEEPSLLPHRLLGQSLSLSRWALSSVGQGRPIMSDLRKSLLVKVPAWLPISINFNLSILGQMQPVPVVIRGYWSARVSRR